MEEAPTVIAALQVFPDEHQVNANDWPDRYHI
jgi:hypothetical protein